MVAPAWERPGDFLGDFGIRADFERAGASLWSAVVLFDEASQDASLGGYVHDTSAVTILAPAGDLAGLTRYDVARVDGRVFDVMASPESDGTGWAKLRLAPQQGSGAR